MSSQRPIDPDADGFSFVDAEHHILEFWKSQKGFPVLLDGAILAPHLYQNSYQAVHFPDPFRYYQGTLGMFFQNVAPCQYPGLCLLLLIL